MYAHPTPEDLHEDAPLGGKKKKKKRIMTKFTISEISGVDVPAQAGARLTIMKRHEEGEVFKGGAALTSNKKGHAHLIFLDSAEQGGHTSHTKSTGEEFGHSHPWVINAEGNIVIGQSEGHDHTVLRKRKFSESALQGLVEKGFALSDGGYPIETVSDFKNSVAAYPLAVDKEKVAAHIIKSAKRLDVEELLPEDGLDSVPLIKASGEPTASAGGDSAGQKDDNTMTDTKKAADQLAAALEKVDGLEKQLAQSNDLAKLTDIEKSHYETLDDAQKAEFLKTSSDERKTQITKAQEDDSVIYKAEDGSEYRKSDDPRLVTMAKKSDEDRKVAKAEREKRESLELQKRVTDDIPHLPGDDAVKIAILKAVDGIKDEELRGKAHQTLKAHDQGLAKAFEQVGHLNKVAEGSPQYQLDELSKAYAKENKVDLALAQSEVLKTSEGQKLYEQTLN